MRAVSVIAGAATPRVRGTHVIELRSIFSPLTLAVFLYAPLLLLHAPHAGIPVFIVVFIVRNHVSVHSSLICKLLARCLRIKKNKRRKRGEVGEPFQ